MKYNKYFKSAITENSFFKIKRMHSRDWIPFYLLVISSITPNYVLVNHFSNMSMPSTSLLCTGWSSLPFPFLSKFYTFFKVLLRTHCKAFSESASPLPLCPIARIGLSSAVRSHNFIYTYFL